MIAFDFERLIKNLSEIPEEEEFDPGAVKEMKKMFLVLAGDQRVIKKLTLEDMEILFNDASWLLDQYARQSELGFEESHLEDYTDIVRRAV